MYFDSFNELLHMGGHGVFVWPAYLATGVSLLGLIIYPLRRKQKLVRAIKQRQRFTEQEKS